MALWTYFRDTIISIKNCDFASEREAFFFLPNNDAAYPRNYNGATTYFQYISSIKYSGDAYVYVGTDQQNGVGEPGVGDWNVLSMPWYGNYTLDAFSESPVKGQIVVIKDESAAAYAASPTKKIIITTTNNNVTKIDGQSGIYIYEPNGYAAMYYNGTSGWFLFAQKGVSAWSGLANWSGQ